MSANFSSVSATKWLEFSLKLQPAGHRIRRWRRRWRILKNTADARRGVHAPGVGYTPPGVDYILSGLGYTASGVSYSVEGPFLK